MDAVRAGRTQSPAPSPHGAIGETIPAGAGSTGVGSGGGSGGSHALAMHHGHGRSASLATPRSHTPNSNVAAGANDNDELDLPALMAQGQKQLELDRARFGRFGIAPPPASAGPGVPLRGRPGSSFGMNGPDGRADSPSAWHSDSDGWRDSNSRSRDTSMHRQGSAGVAASSTATPTGASLYVDQAFASPIGRARGSMGGSMGGFGAAPNASSDPASAAQHHLVALSNILGPLCQQGDELIRLRAEVELRRSEWQRCDRERRRLDEALQSDDPAKGRPKFSVALLDGDGLIFKDEHLRNGFSGGQAAARKLIAELPIVAGRVRRDSVDAALGNAADVKPRELGPVLVNVFLNKTGLGQVLVKSGSVPSWNVYEAFWHGFGGAHDLFSVIDVGQGKEATDNKIREHLKLYINNVQCDTVFLGASHDNSYASVLNSLETTSGLSKLVILQGYLDLAAQLQAYKNRCAAIPELFRSARLPPIRSAFSPHTPSINGTLQAQQQQPPKPAETKHAEAKPRRLSKTVFDKTSPPAAAPVQSEPEAEVVEWDKLIEENEVLDLEDVPRPKRFERQTPSHVTSAAPAPQAPSDAASVVDDDPKRRFIPVGKRGKPSRPSTVLTVRNLKPRPCHTFYLSPWGCKNGDNCEYAHTHKLNEEQTQELARLAKEIICPYVRSQRCHFREAECVYGHRCPRGNNCGFGDTCRFKDLPNGHGEEDEAPPASNAHIAPHLRASPAATAA